MSLRSLIGALAICVLSPSLEAALTVQQTPAGYVVSGTPNGRIAFIWRNNTPQVAWVDLDAAGSATLRITEPFVIVDVTTGEGAGPAGTVMTPLPARSLVNSPGHGSIIFPAAATAFPPTIVQALWVRPGVGVWTPRLSTLYDLDSSDRNPYIYTTTTTDRFVSFPGSPAVPAAFERGDLFYAIRGNTIFGGPVAAELDRAPAAGQFHLVAPYSSQRLLDEGNVLELPILRVDGVDGAVSIRVRTVAGTAVPNVDYTPVDQIVTFAAGEVFKRIETPTLQDALWASHRTVTIEISEPSGAPIASEPSFTYTIADDEPRPVVTLSAPATVVETDAPQTIPVTVRVSGTIRRTPFAIRRSIDSNTIADLVVQPTESEVTWLVPVPGDDVPLGNRQIVLDADGVKAMIQVIDDDLPPLTFAESVVAMEGATATLSGAVAQLPGRPVSLVVSTVDGTAKAGTDYVAVSNLQLNGHADISVVLLDDAAAEGAESFFIEISNVSNAAPNRTRIEVIIADNDDLPLPQFAQMQAAEGNGNVYRRVDAVLTLPQAPLLPRSFSIGPRAGGTATIIGDYQWVLFSAVTFQPGQTSASFPISIYGDDQAEANETILIGVAGTNVTGTFTILDDDDPSLPLVVIDDTSVNEGTGANSAARFRIALTAAATQPVSVAYSTSAETATAGADYVESARTITFATGEVIREISVDVMGDGIDEENETFKVTLSDPAGLKIARGVATGTIVDDDKPARRRAVRK